MARGRPDGPNVPTNNRVSDSENVLGFHSTLWYWPKASSNTFGSCMPLPEWLRKLDEPEPPKPVTSASITVAVVVTVLLTGLVWLMGPG